MAQVLILTTSDNIDNINENTSSIPEYSKDTNTSDLEEILDRAFYTNCPECVAKFMDDIKKAGLFKFYWEPFRFIRNIGTFVHYTSKYELVLTIEINDKEMRIANKNFITHFSGIVKLKIRNKYDSCKSKNVTLFDLYCDSLDKDTKIKYINSMRDFIRETFGIDFEKWNEILTDTDYKNKTFTTGYYHS